MLLSMIEANQTINDDDEPCILCGPVDVGNDSLRLNTTSLEYITVRIVTMFVTTFVTTPSLVCRTCAERVSMHKTPSLFFSRLLVLSLSPQLQKTSTHVVVTPGWR